MTNKNIFNEKETNLLIEALAIYLNCEIPKLRIDLHLELISSCTNKLMSLTSLTTFSKQEFSMMYFALDYMPDAIGKEPSGIYRLKQKVYKYATP